MKWSDCIFKAGIAGCIDPRNEQNHLKTGVQCADGASVNALGFQKSLKCPRTLRVTLIDMLILLVSNTAAVLSTVEGKR